MFSVIQKLIQAVRRRRTNYLDLPNELVLQIAELLQTLDLYSLLRVNHRHASLLGPTLLQRAAPISSLICLRTVFHWAASRGMSCLAKRLVDNYGAAQAVNRQDNMGVTPLHSAVLMDHSDMVDLLLFNNAHMEIKTDGLCWTALHLAVFGSNYSMARKLLLSGADPNAPVDIHNNTALNYAVENGDDEMVRLLTENGANTGVQPTGRTFDTESHSYLSYRNYVDIESHFAIKEPSKYIARASRNRRARIHLI